MKFLTVDSDQTNKARVMKFGTKVHLMDSPKELFQIHNLEVVTGFQIFFGQIKMLASFHEI